MRSFPLICALVALGWGCSDGGGDDPVSQSGGAGGESQQGGAGGAPPAGTTQVSLFAPAADPAATALGQIPWPSDAYLTADGALDFQGFPRPPRMIPVFEDIITAAGTETRGFGTTATMYAAFAGAIDQALLPQDATESLADDSAALVVDIDPDSPTRGKRWPINWRYNAAGSNYLPPNTLMIRLVEGLALTPSTTYALIITTKVGEPAEGFAQLLGDSAPGGAPWSTLYPLYQPLRDWLADDGGRGGAGVEVASASVFTTQDPVSELFTLRDFIHNQPAPGLVEIDGKGEFDQLFEVFEGTYEAPIFQEGEIPYRFAGGGIRFEADGTPKIQGTEPLRFALTTPLGPPPPGGWPIVLYAHGTGGDYRSFIRSNVSNVLARNDTAVISIDQIHHGPRNHGACQSGDSGCEQLLFFNFLNPVAGRDNVRQSALDYVTLLRFVQGLQIPGEETLHGEPITFDRDNVMFMGHSQGGLNGPLFMAVEPTVRGGMLSGAGASIAISVEQKTDPASIAAPVSGLLGLPDEDPLDRWHPVLMLIQTFIEPGDGLNYARFWFAEPPPGYAPKSVFMTVGLEDTYTPPETTFALAVAGRVPVITPEITPIEGLGFVGASQTELPPYAGNVADRQATAGLAQYQGEGHFLIFEVPSARQRYGRFLNSLATEDPPKIF